MNRDRMNDPITRRSFLARSSTSIAAAALASLLPSPSGRGAGVGGTHFAAKAKNVIFLFMGGGPSHVDTFDPKPILRQRHNEEMPPSILGTQRVTLMTR